MTINLPPRLETHILAAVSRGRYGSLDDAMAEAAAMLVDRLQREQAEANPPVTNQAEPVPTDKPIWEIAAEIRKGIPPEEFAKLPKDGAEQVDHDLYGSPERPTS